MPVKLLVVEDEKSILKLLRTILTANKYEVVEASTGAEALSLITSHCPDLILLDLGLPDMDGNTLLSSVRKWTSTPVIVLSARTHESDKVEAIDLGADDYITKPFSPSELVARVDAVYRRVSMSSAKQEPETELRSGPFQLNIRSRSLTRDGQKIDLTQVEFQLMEHFMRNPNVALDRSALLATVWGDSYFGDDKIVDVNVRRLRMKIEPEPSNPKYLTTVWGFGYKWVE